MSNCWRVPLDSGGVASFHNWDTARPGCLNFNRGADLSLLNIPVSEGPVRYPGAMPAHAPARVTASSTSSASNWPLMYRHYPAHYYMMPHWPLIPEAPRRKRSAPKRKPAKKPVRKPAKKPVKKTVKRKKPTATRKRAKK